MDGKVRFDIKQVAQWDRQNEQEHKKKAFGATKPPGKQPYKKNSLFDEDKDDGGFDHGYRDRALERRKDANTEETQMEEIVSKLDVEQTKYLGGDMEHTHLVKGLDYALLEKTRRQKEKEDELARIAEAAKADVLSLDQIEPTTAIGAEVLRGLRKLQLLEQRTTGPHSASSILRRTAYDFDIRPDSEVDVPLLVTRSKTELAGSDEYVNFMPDNDVMTQLATLLESGKLLAAKQRRKKMQKEEAERAAQEHKEKESSTAEASTVPGSSGAARLVDDDFDIYGEDMVVGKYIPVGSLEEGGSAEARSSGVGAAVGNSSSSGTGSAVKANSLFSGLLPPASSAAGALGASRSSGAGSGVKQPHTGKEEEADLMKPIRDLLSAQAAKERAVKERHLAQQQEAEQRREMVLEKDEKGKLLVHRDVFATSRDNVVNVGEGKESKEKTKRGEVFGTQGGYDLFPETAPSYNQFFDSDDETGGDPTDAPASKKSRLEGGAGGAGGGSSRGGGASGGGGGSEWDRPLKSGGGGGGAGHVHKTGLEGLAKKGGMTPWRQQPGSSNGGGGGGGAGGMNRAARRAAGAK